MRIGIDASRVQPGFPTGTEHYAEQVIRGLIDLDAPHEYILYRRNKPLTGDLFARSSVSQQVLGPPRLWTHLGLSYEMLRRPPDILFVPAHVLPIFRRLRTVVTVHDLGYLYYPKAHRRLAWWYLHLSTMFHVRVATRIIADSNATKMDLVRWYHADAGKIKVVYLAADECFRPVRSEAVLAAARQEYAEGRDYILHLGTLQPRKNIAGLLDAYHVLRKTIPNPPALVIAGKRGWLAEPIYAKVAHQGLADDVKFVNYVPPLDLPALISAAVALAFPSFYEGFGLPALEAMACGVAVVGSNASSLPEVIGDAGILVDPHDTVALTEALKVVCTDREKRNALGALGRARAAKFSWSRCARETLEVLQEAGDR